MVGSLIAQSMMLRFIRSKRVKCSISQGESSPTPAFSMGSTFLKVI